MNLTELKTLFTDELLNYCVSFWLDNAVDTEYGGIINCLDREGKVYSNDKSVWMQGRCGWMFSYLYNNIKKDEKFLEIAKSCIDFAKTHCIDADGRMFFTVTREGLPLRKRRYWFSETFYIIANAEYYIATGDKAYLSEAVKYFDFIYDIYRNPQNDPYKITPKGYASTRDTKSLACPMIMLNVTAVIRNADRERAELYDKISRELVNDIKAFHNYDLKATFETIGADGEFIMESQSTRVINPGHDIECSWFLLEEAKRTNDHALAEFAKLVFDCAYERGYDREYGGIVYFKDVLGTPVEAYEHDMKLWWVHNETIIAALMFYKYTGDEKYKEILDTITDYAFSHFSDREFGEWYGYLRRDGKPTEPACKGHTYKGPFHVMRMLSKCITMID